MKEILLAVLVLTGLSGAFAVLLAWCSKRFHVEVDQRLTQVIEFLPGINCGACGLAGCASFAESVLEQKVDVSVCVACSVENKQAIAAILGLSIEVLDKTDADVAVIGCGGGINCKNKFEYRGLADCRVAAITMSSHKECKYACLEQGNCVRICPFGAIEMQKDGVPRVIIERCVGCKKCVKACPRQIIFMKKKKKEVYINCHSRDKGAQVVKKCNVGCIACGKCVKACPVSAIEIIDNLAKIDYIKCINCKKCVSVCPRKIIFFNNEKTA